MPIFEGKYDFRRAGEFGRTYRPLASNLCVPEYQELAVSYTASIDRLVFLWELPLQLIYWSSLLSKVHIFARHRRSHDIEDASRDTDLDHLRIAQELLDEMVRNEGSALDYSLSPLGQMLGDERLPALPQACEGVEASFAAMVMAAYAAFETLAADLWIAAVNRDPILATNWLEKNRDKQVPLNVFAGYGFDASKKMGTILHDTRKVSFESLHDIRQAYDLAFKGGVNLAFDSIDDIICAEKTRHLFAHRGGLIDRKFLDEMRGRPEYTNAAIGERLRLTGPVTGRHVEACVNCGIGLLTLTDNWSASQA